MEEIWKRSRLAPEFEVSNYGRIKNIETGRWASQFTLNGYLATNRSKKYTDSPNQVKIFIHRLVAYEFVEGYKEGLVVNHIDGCKTNNFASNLEWVDRAANITECYNPNKVYTQDILDTIYNDMRNNGLSQKDIGIKYNISECYVGKLLYNNLHSKDIDAIKYLYNSGIYNIAELSSIYKVDEKIIKNCIL